MGQLESQLESQLEGSIRGSVKRISWRVSQSVKETLIYLMSKYVDFRSCTKSKQLTYRVII